MPFSTNSLSNTAVPPPVPELVAPRHVWAGEFEVATGNIVLTSLLGSCVGIGLIWRRKGRCALAHCLLGEAPPNEQNGGGRYVSTAIPAMLRALGARPGDYPELEVVAAGGASLFGKAQLPVTVGSRNIAALERSVNALGLRVIHQRLGGQQGCRITLRCKDMSFDIHDVGNRMAGVR